MGSNLGDCEETLRHAIAALSRFLADPVVAPLYRSDPVGAHSQEPYLNTVVIGRSLLPPRDLVAVGKALEYGAGRRRGPRFGPRVLDVDLLLCGDRVSDDIELTIPHPRLRTRRFYLAPLADIAPTLRVPPDGVTVGELLASVGSSQAVERIGWSIPLGGL